MPAGFQQLGANLFYGDSPPNGPNEGAIWVNGSGQPQVFQNGRWRNLLAGYTGGTSQGGTVTQITSKATGVTLNALTGTIVTHNAALNTLVPVAFVVTNSYIGANDVVAIVVQSGAANAQTYLVGIGAVAAGSFTVVLFNTSGGSLSEALTLQFVVLKGAAT